MKTDKGIIILLIVFLAGFGFLFKPWIHSSDPVGYYSWLRSAIIDGDINVTNEFQHYKSEIESANEKIITLENGYTVNKWAIGSAILWSPFFIIAHILTSIASFLGFSVAADGYSAPYVWAISLGSSLYGFGAILLTYTICRDFFNMPVRVLAVMTTWLSTTLVYYMYSHPTMAHANDAFCYALFIFVWYKTRNSQRWSSPVLRGITLGLCALVRQVNAIFVFFVIGEFTLIGLRRWNSTRKLSEIKSALSAILIFSLSWWLVYLPQIVVWRIVFGQWVMNPYAFVGEHFDFNPLRALNVFNVLMSTNRGLLVWTPIVIPALIGIKFLWEKSRALTAMLTFNLLSLLFVISSWHYWYAGAGPGSRFFTHMVPTFMLGLGALLDKFEKRHSLKWIIAICASSIAWYGITLIRYAVEDIPRWGDVALDKLIFGQFLAIPKYFWRVVEIILTRT